MGSSVRLIFSLLLQIIYSNSIFFLTSVPKTLGYKVVVPNIVIDIVCIAKSDILQTKCFNKNDPMDNETLLLFPVLDANNTLIFNDEKNLFVGIQCFAPYPVEWVHYQEPWLTIASENWMTLARSQTTLFMRSVKTLDDPSTFTYSSLLGLHNIKSDSKLVVGLYTCQSMNSSSTPQSHVASVPMAVFRQRKVYDQAFPLSGKNVTVWMNEGHHQKIIFPCYVSYQNVTVNLYKRTVHYIPSNKKSMIPQRKLNSIQSHTNKIDRSITESKPSVVYSNESATEIENWEIIYPNHQLQYIPYQGFVFQKDSDNLGNKLSSFQLSPGIYKCSVAKEDDKDEETNDFVLINLKQGGKPETTRFNQAISPGGKAHFSYKMFGDKNLIQIECCSNSSKPPTLYMISCFTRPTCENQMNYFQKLETDLLGKNRLSTKLGNCRKSFNISHAFKIPLNVKCIGDGINYSETFIFPLENNTSTNEMKPYVRWEDVDPYKMLTLTIPHWDKRSQDKTKILLYKNQKITITCATSTAYFAVGSRITVDLRNGTRRLLQEDKEVEKNIQVKWGFPKYDLVGSLNVSEDMTSISCHGAIVNSAQWIKKTIQVQIEDGEAAKIFKSTDMEEIYLTLNETSRLLKCEFSGIPAPVTVEWRKDNQVIKFQNDTNALYNHNMLTHNTSALMINVATYEIHGRYKCTVENMFGNATKVFQIYVRAPESGWIFMSTSLGLGCFVVAIIFLGVYTWRERKHLIKKQHLFHN